MAFCVEGKLEIPLEDFWQFVGQYLPEGLQSSFGVPITNKSNQTLEIDFALGDATNPTDWLKKPACLRQWEEI